MNALTPIKQQSGISLLEVLIALLVLAVGVLGFAGLQMTSLNQSTAANHRVTAVLIAQDAVERMELNPSMRDTYLNASWNAAAFGGSPNSACITNNCTAGGIADWDLAQLTWQAANLLPAGQIAATDCAFNSRLTCVVVSWDEQNPDACTSAVGINMDSDSNCFVLEVAR